MLIDNTVVMLTSIPGWRGEWQVALSDRLNDAQGRGPSWQIEVEFFTALLALLDDQPVGLPEGHPYAAALTAVLQSVASGGQAQPPQFDPELVSCSMAALLGAPQAKMAHAQYLAGLAAQHSEDTGVQRLISAIQTALFGAALDSLGGELDGPHREAWDAIVQGVALDGLDPDLFDTIISNTLAALGSADQRDGWREQLQTIQMQTQQDKPSLAALVGEISALLDAGGDSSRLGQGLQGIYAQVWQALVERLPPRQEGTTPA